MDTQGDVVVTTKSDSGLLANGQPDMKYPNNGHSFGGIFYDYDSKENTGPLTYHAAEAVEMPEEKGTVVGNSAYFMNNIMEDCIGTYKNAYALCPSAGNTKQKALRIAIEGKLIGALVKEANSFWHYIRSAMQVFKLDSIHKARYHKLTIWYEPCMGCLVATNDAAIWWVEIDTRLQKLLNEAQHSQEYMGNVYGSGFLHSYGFRYSFIFFPDVDHQNTATSGCQQVWMTPTEDQWKLQVRVYRLIKAIRFRVPKYWLLLQRPEMQAMCLKGTRNWMHMYCDDCCQQKVFDARMLHPVKICADSYKMKSGFKELVRKEDQDETAWRRMEPRYLCFPCHDPVTGQHMHLTRAKCWYKFNYSLNGLIVGRVDHEEPSVPNDWMGNRVGVDSVSGFPSQGPEQY